MVHLTGEDISTRATSELCGVYKGDGIFIHLVHALQIQLDTCYKWMLIQKILGRYQNSHKMVNKFRQWIIVVMSVIFTVNNIANDMIILREMCPAELL